MKKLVEWPYLFVLQALTLLVVLSGCQSTESGSVSKSGSEPTLRMGIAPYQEIALLVNEKPLALEQKYGVKLELITMPWEELLTAVASAGPTIDVGFASLSDYLAKAERLNSQKDDPIVYLYPAWTFHGGGLITFNAAVPEITKANVSDKELLKRFLKFKIGVQKNSCCDMLVWKLAHDAGVPYKDLQITDTTLNDGLLATENGSLDVAGAGLTQRTEAIKRKGRVVLTMDTLGLTDPGGFVCKKSFYTNHKKEVDALIHIWFDCTNYVLSDLDKNSQYTLDYLKANASTKYTLAEFKSALSQEYIARSVHEAQQEVVSGKGLYSIATATKEINEYLLNCGAVKTPCRLTTLIEP